MFLENIFLNLKFRLWKIFFSNKIYKKLYFGKYFLEIYYQFNWLDPIDVE